MNPTNVEKNLRILVIDDNRAIHDDFRKILCATPGRSDALDQAESLLFATPAGRANAPKRNPFTIDSAFQGQEGLEKARQALAEGRPYALAFVDVRMPPGWDGIETAARIWEVCPDLQIVICTAYSDYSWDEMSAKLNSSDRLVILKKPFDTVEVLQLANALTEKWRLHQEVRTKLNELEGLVQERTKVLQQTNEKLGLEIAERQRAAEALRESEERYGLMFQWNPLPMWVVDMKTLAIIAVNETAVTAYGYSREQFLVMTLKDLQPRDQVAELARRLAEVESLPGHVFRTRHRKQDGRVIDVEIVTRTINFSGREARLTVAHDITERKAAEDRIYEQAALLDLAHDAIFVKDWEGKIKFWNKGAEQLFGWTAAEAVGRPAEELFTTPSPWETAVRELVEKGEWSGELQKQTKAGKKVIVNSGWTLLRDDEDRPRSVLVIEADITEKKKLETQFLRAQRMEGIGTLATGMAHDLNNILAPILISAGTLRWDLGPEEREDAIKHIEGGVKRGAEVIRQVLTFGRGVEGDRVAVSPGELLKEAVNIVTQTFPKDITLSHEIADGLWPIIGDKTQIHQVLLNLSINARDAMPKGGQLRLSAKNINVDDKYPVLHAPGRPGPYVIFEVADSGCGIAPGDIERIFDPFFTTKEFGKGTGLGLSTVLGIVKSHQGLIAVESQPGKGTTFKVLFPVSSEAVRTIVSQRPMPLPRAEGELILIVDDEVNIVATNRQMLCKHGYRVLSASNGQEALEVFKQNRDNIKMVVTDIMMPGMDGIGLIRALKAIAPNLKIIASSGLGSGSKGQDREAELKALGATYFLAKPYSAQRLLEALNAIVRQSKASPGTPAEVAIATSEKDAECVIS